MIKFRGFPLLLPRLTMQLRFSLLLCVFVTRLVAGGNTNNDLPGKLLSSSSPNTLKPFLNNGLGPRDEEKLISSLLVRQSVCPSGYGECSDGSGCCPLNSHCCIGSGSSTRFFFLLRSRKANTTTRVLQGWVILLFYWLLPQ